MRPIQDVVADVIAAADAVDRQSLALLREELQDRDTPEALALTARIQGFTTAFAGAYEEARTSFEAALAFYEGASMVTDIAYVSSNLGRVHVLRGDPTLGIEWYKKALALFEDLGDRSGSARVFNNLGSVYSTLGSHGDAVMWFTRALAAYKELDDRQKIADSHLNIGVNYEYSGSYPEVLDHLDKALALYEELGARSMATSVWSNIGTVHHLMGYHTVAFEYYSKALSRFEEAGDRAGVAAVTVNIGKVHESAESYEEGLTWYYRSWALCEEVGDMHGKANAMCNIGYTLARLERFEEARDIVQQVEASAFTFPQTVVARNHLRGIVSEHDQDFDGARASYLAAIDHARTFGMRAEESAVQKALRDLAQKRNDLASYIEHNNAFTRIEEEIRGKDTATRLAMQEAEKKMAKERNEHEKHLAILHSTLPKHIADRVARGEVVNDHHENAAVIFLDIVGFTSISDQLSSAEVVLLLESVFTALDDVCKIHDVVKIKTIGDSYMAVAFPQESSSSEQRATNPVPRDARIDTEPVPRDARNDNEPVPHSVRNDSVLTSFVNEARDVALRAADTALDMLTSIGDLPETLPASLRETLRATLPTGLQVRIGLHAGAVTAGVIGKERLQYDVWGDTVNVASRMESTSLPGRIHVSEAFASLLSPSPSHLRERGANTTSTMHEGVHVIPNVSEEPGTWHLAHGTWHLELRGETELKGKGTMTTYWLEGITT